jgi:hypothetical protein
MQEAIEYGIGDGGVADPTVPAGPLRLYVPFAACDAQLLEDSRQARHAQ